MYVGALTLDVLLGDVRSLKQKRSVVRPLIAEVHRRFPGVAVGETGYLDLHRRAEIGIAVVSSTAANAREVLEACERFVAGRPEIELLAARQRLLTRGGVTEPMNQVRARKLGDRIAVIVAEMLERRVKDPRLGFVTVTEARVTGDLREATVFYTVYGSADEVAGTAAALASAAGLIRSEVGRQTGLKHTPSISFSQDTVPDTARTIEDLVARARAADAAVAAARADAVPAGDPDPYRASTVDDDESARATDDDELDDDEPSGQQ